jgi:DNA-binding XRE family transcriptional regulator
MTKTVNAATVGAVVRDARIAAGLTQTQLGKRIGASRFWVAEFEKGKPSAALGLALRALHALGLTVHIEPTNASKGAARSKMHRPEVHRTDLAKVIAHATVPTEALSSVAGWPATPAPSGRSRKP